ncbi:MAG: response regulator transcription factor [Candidatus Melainabacteria bacterium]|nr:response regulator transcription factor [Candidatus Melainabacteria bacterium]
MADHTQATQSLSTAKAKATPVIRVFLVDDHAVVRQGTAGMLLSDPGIVVVGEADNGQQLLDRLQATEADVLLLDVNLPEESGLSLLGKLRGQLPQLKILMFSAFNDLAYVRQSVALKANGYLSKTISGQALCRAIHQVYNASADASPVLSEDLPPLAEVLHGKPSFAGSAEKLTPRELEVLVYVARGETNRDIAKALIVSVKTIDTHVANLMKKLAANNRSQLTAIAYSQGLL